MSVYLTKIVVKLAETSSHPSRWFPQSVTLITMYEPIGEFTYEVTSLITADESPDNWLSQEIEGLLTPDDKLVGLVILEVPDEEVQAHREDIASRMIGLKLG